MLSLELFHQSTYMRLSLLMWKASAEEGMARPGLCFYDIANPDEPKEVAFYTMGGLSKEVGTGVHLF
jgi:hypothetical protein